MFSDAIQKKRTQSYDEDYSLNVLFLMAKNDFHLDISSFITDKEERSRLYFAAGKEIEKVIIKNQLAVSIVKTVHKQANKLMFLAPRRAIQCDELARNNKEPGSMTGFWMRQSNYEKLGQNRQALSHYVNSASKG